MRRVNQRLIREYWSSNRPETPAPASNGVYFRCRLVRCWRSPEQMQGVSAWRRRRGPGCATPETPSDCFPSTTRWGQGRFHTCRHTSRRFRLRERRGGLTQPGACSGPLGPLECKLGGQHGWFHFVTGQNQPPWDASNGVTTTPTGTLARSFYFPMENKCSGN